MNRSPYGHESMVMSLCIHTNRTMSVYSSDVCGFVRKLAGLKNVQLVSCLQGERFPTHSGQDDGSYVH